MHTDRFAMRGGRPDWGRGHRHGGHGGPARLMPFIVGALAMRAALRHGHHQEEYGGEGRRYRGRDSWGHGHWAHEHKGRRYEGRGPWGWGRGEWHEHEGRGEHRYEHEHEGRGEHGHDAPWGRGRRHGRHDFGPGRAALFGLRSEVVPLALLLRDAFRGGHIDEHKVGEIRAVLAEAHRRIAAILAEPREARNSVDMV